MLCLLLLMITPEPPIDDESQVDIANFHVKVRYNEFDTMLNVGSLQTVTIQVAADTQLRDLYALGRSAITPRSARYTYTLVSFEVRESEFGSDLKKSVIFPYEVPAYPYP